MRNHTRRSIALALSLATATTAGIVATAAPAEASSSTAMPTGNVKSNGRTWVQVYKEGFNTTAAKGQFLAKYPKISAYKGYSDTSGHGEYDPTNVLSVKDGYLDYDLHTVKGTPRVASISPGDYMSLKTGRMSIRFKTSKTNGYKFVGIFWPDDGVWNEGEIDWPEISSLGAKPRPASAIPGTYKNGNMTFQPTKETFASTDTTGWHIATTEWDKSIVRFYWDGKLVASTTKAVPKNGMHVQLQAETAIGQAKPAASVTGHVDVDWISLWK